MGDGQHIVVLSSGVEDDYLVIAVFGPYESEAEAGEHVGIFRNPEMLKRLRPGLDISTSQHPLEDPSAFAERVGGTAYGRRIAGRSAGPVFRNDPRASGPASSPE